MVGLNVDGVRDDDDDAEELYVSAGDGTRSGESAVECAEMEVDVVQVELEELFDEEEMLLILLLLEETVSLEIE